MSTLGDVVTFTNGGTPSRSRTDFWDGAIPWITGADIGASGSVKPRAFISEEAVRSSSTRVLPVGTVLLVTRTAVGKVGVLPRAMAINQDITGVTPSAEIDARYLVWFLRARASALSNKARGATIKGVSRNDVASLLLELPPVDEQRRIAEVLDHADSIRSKRREIGKHLAALTPSIFRSMFTGTTQRSRLGDLATTTSGGTPSRAVAANFDGHIPWVKSGELHSGLVTATEERISSVGLASSSAKLLPAGTVLLAMYGATAGVVGRLGIDAATNQAICSITPGARLDAEYLVHALRSQTEALVSRASGGAQPNLSQATVRDFEIPVPDISDQQRFAKYSNAITQRQLAAERAAAAADELFASLQSRAFRGEL